MSRFKAMGKAISVKFIDAEQLGTLQDHEIAFAGEEERGIERVCV